MWPAWGDVDPAGKDIANAIANLQGYRVGAVVSCTNDLPDATLARFRALLGSEADKPIVLPGLGTRACMLFYRRPLSSASIVRSGSVFR
jgi:hypothetical protein